MQHLPPRSATLDASISLADLARYTDGWLLACEIAQHSSRTIGNRKEIVNHLLWFLRQREYASCGTMELRQFLAYVTNGHKEQGGRWGNPQQTRPVRPRTVKDYHNHLRTLFRWIVTEGGLDASPMERIPAPTARPTGPAPAPHGPAAHPRPHRPTGPDPALHPGAG